MGSLGSDAAIEAADVVLMDDDIRKIASTVLISRKTLRIVKQNIVFALAVKAVVLLLEMCIRDRFSAIVAENNRTVAKMFVLCDAAYDGGCIVIFPVEGIHIPLNRIIFIFPAHTDKSVVIVPVRRAEQNHIFTG